ncbi:hypothetical protein O0L34_g10828 [Tuta absoluta]|nr:hypothetical protein O0L34_g10828 [Tuta absoluta]
MLIVFIFADETILSEGSGLEASVNRTRLISVGQHLWTSSTFANNGENFNTIITEGICYKCEHSGTYKVLCIFVTLAAVVPIRIILTKRGKIERKLLSKLNRYRDILNTISVGVITTDYKNNITYMNKTAGRMFGWRPKYAIGKKIDDVARFDKEVSIQNYNDVEVDLKDLNMLCSKDEKYAKVLQNEGRSFDIQLMTSHLPQRKGTSGHVIVLLDVTSTRAHVKELSYRAAHDALTGLPNRDSFERYLRNATVNDAKHAIVFVDLDGFKNINDTAGHAAGDALLQQVAKLMKGQIRHTDFVARLGGDEFGLILFNCGLQQAEALMKVLVKQINDYQFCWQGEVLHFGASVGITTVGSCKDLGVIITEADKACYEAKRRGKGQVCVYTDL